MDVKGFILRIARKFQKAKKESIDESILEDLLDRILKLEKRQEELETVLSKKEYRVENIVIENMHADKVEFNLDAIDVKELSGMLSIGLNYEGKLVKVYTQENDKTKKEGREIKSSKGSEEVQTPKPKLNMFFEP